MSASDVVDIMRQMMLVCFQMAGPPLIAGIVVGLVVAIFQAATQIHEQTLTFVPKLLVIALMLLLMGTFFMAVMQGFVDRVFALMLEV